MTADIGLIGLAVMGQNLALNMAEKGFSVVVYNRTVSKVHEFLEGPAKGFSIEGCTDLRAFFSTLKRPRKVIFMVKAGQPIDDLIAQSLPFVEPGDILIDGGNSYFLDTQRRVRELGERGIHFLGVGISGGEEGARHGPSIMPGGASAAWPSVQPILQRISAVVGKAPCCDWVGEGGAGHFVKMVHNGIEYADMQLIAETYDVLKRGCGLPDTELAETFRKWNEGRLKSYLIEITASIFDKKDADGSPLVEKILDVAEQKGTGKWTVATALDLGMPLPLIAEAVFARNLSALYEDRQVAGRLLGDSTKPIHIAMYTLTRRLEQALYAAKIISYAQGFLLMYYASKEYGWRLNLGACALMWRGGCIIRSAFLGKIAESYERNPGLSLLILDPFFNESVRRCLPALRWLIGKGATVGIPLPCYSSALAWYDGMRSPRLPTNLLQAQRDFFGAHTFERVDQPRGVKFHVTW